MARKIFTREGYAWEINAIEPRRGYAHIEVRLRSIVNIEGESMRLWTPLGFEMKLTSQYDGTTQGGYAFSVESVANCGHGARVVATILSNHDDINFNCMYFAEFLEGLARASGIKTVAFRTGESTWDMLQITKKDTAWRDRVDAIEKDLQRKLVGTKPA